MAYKIKVKPHKVHRGGRTFRVKGYERKKSEKPIGTMKVAGRNIQVKESKNYIHYVIRPNAKGQTRVLDIGEPKRHEIIRVHTKAGWVTRSVRVQRHARVSPSQTREIIRKAVLYQGK